MKYDTDTTQAIRDYNAHQLAHRADSYASNDEAASFFTSIRDAVLEAVEYTDAEDWQRQMVEDYSGSASEIADGAPDVYTYPKWQDLDELSGPTEDMDANASVALYIIAQRLVSALAVEIQDAISD